jgi:glycosyltransferase involved in cell wall biosynthesis
LTIFAPVGSAVLDLITVGITCFNAEDTIERAVRSALDQNWDHLEVVIVDDCSRDGSRDILNRLAAGERRLRIELHPENRGVAAARNTVLENASGEFVAFFDDDDNGRPDRLVHQHRRIVEYEKTAGTDKVVCYCATEQIFPDGNRYYSPTMGMDVTPAPSGEDVARLILTGKPVAGGAGACPTSSVMARRSVFELAGGFDVDFRRQEDTDLNLRLALAGVHFAGLSQPFVVQTVTITPDKTVEEEHRYSVMLFDKHRGLLERWGWYGFGRAWLDMKYAKLRGDNAAALWQLAALSVSSPVKTARKLIWSAPNRQNYRRYRYQDNTDGDTAAIK